MKGSVIITAGKRSTKKQKPDLQESDTPERPRLRLQITVWFHRFQACQPVSYMCEAERTTSNHEDGHRRAHTQQRTTQSQRQIRNSCHLHHQRSAPLCRPPAAVVSSLWFRSWLPLWSECPACWPPALRTEHCHSVNERTLKRENKSAFRQRGLTTAVRPVGLQRVSCILSSRGADQVAVFVSVVGVGARLCLLCLSGSCFCQRSLFL